MLARVAMLIASWTYIWNRIVSSQEVHWTITAHTLFAEHKECHQWLDIQIWPGPCTQCSRMQSETGASVINLRLIYFIGKGEQPLTKFVPNGTIERRNTRIDSGRFWLRANARRPENTESIVHVELWHGGKHTQWTYLPRRGTEYTEWRPDISWTIHS